MTFRQLRRAVRADLAQEHRYAHSLRVARLAASLARAHGEDSRTAAVAGMLHDLARLFDADRLVRECTSRGMVIDDFELAHPVVLHARLGAELARERYGVADDAVLSAIRAHTLGAPGMSRLDAIVYLADALEPGRDFAGRAELMRLAYADVDDAMRAVLASTAGYLRARNLVLAPQTRAAMAQFGARGDRPAAREESSMENRLCRT